MSAKYDSDGKAELELRSPLRNERKTPSDDEVAACRPCRIALVVIFTLILVALLVAAVVVIATSKKCGSPLVGPAYWRKETFYQIYVPSFQDTSGDGYGDLKGLQDHLTYLEEVGVKGIVLSGLVNQGEFTATHRREDDNKFKELVTKARDRGISVFLAFDPTHSTTESVSFKKSRESKDNKFRSWYHWVRVSNNWLNRTGQSAWHFDTKTNESYYAYSGVFEPVLNYNNSEVVEHLKKSLSHWLDMGAKGFQFINFQRLIISGSYQSNPASKTTYNKDLRATHQLLEKLHSHVAAKGGILFGGLEKTTDQSRIMSYFGTEKKQELDLVANTYFTEPLKTTAQNIQAGEAINNTLVQYEKSIPSFAWPSWIFGGPEYQRLAGRYTKAEYFWLYIVLQLSLPGCPMFYYGDELGLDSRSLEAMAWNTKRNGGFTTANSPWYTRLTITPKTNVEREKTQNGSFAIFKALNLLRVKEPSLHSNRMTVLAAKGNVIILHRYETGSKGFIIAMNFGNQRQTTNYNTNQLKNTVVEIDTLFTMKGRELGVGTITLQPFQAFVLRVLE